MRKMAAVIESKGIVKNYRDIEALRGIDLTVPEGIFGFIGPNGAGKTTFIKIAVGKLSYDGGTIKVTGTDDVMQIRKNVGILHDRPAFPPEVPVGFFLEQVGEIYGLSQSSVANAIDSCGLRDVEDRDIGTLSLGYTKRLGIAQAVLHDPKLIIADEPFTQLDPMSRMNMKELFFELRKERGISFFISSHDILDLEQIADHFAIIDKGRIVKEGTILTSTDIYVRSTANRELLAYLRDKGVEAALDGENVRLIDAEMKTTLSYLAQFSGTIAEVKTYSLESILRNTVAK